ncbi:MAG: DNRLRE domain-containing protein [Candidatus Hadarchaeales archaeon]
MRGCWALATLLFFTLVGVVQARTVTLISQADTYVDNSNPDSSFGSFSSLLVENSGDVSRLGYLMFYLNEIPSTAEIFSAKLYLRCSYFSPSLPLVYRVAQPVSESMTWNTNPGYLPGWYASGTTEGDWAQWDVREAVEAALPAGYVSFCLRYPTSDPRYTSGFYSREAYYRPRLEVTYNSPPVIESYQVSPSQSAPWGTPLTFTLRCSDPDGDTLSVTLLINGNSYDMNPTAPNTFRYVWTPAKEEVGAKSFRFRVTDGSRSVESPSYSLLVEKRPSSLSLTCSPSTKISFNQRLTLTGTLNPALTGVAVNLTLLGPDNALTNRLVYTEEGSFSLILENWTPSNLGRWRAVASWAGDRYYAGATSREVSFEVTKASSSLFCTGLENLTRADRKIIVSGGLDPPLQGRKVSLTFKVGGASFTEEVTTGPGGGFSFEFEPRELAEKHGVKEWTGEWEIRVGWEGSEVYFGAARLYRMQVLPPLWVEEWFPLVSALSVGALGGLTVAVVRMRRTYLPQKPKSGEKLVFELVRADEA